MRTITFYSYKGGVGRTLVLANIAHYLSRFGKKVFALDLDLEAPGLHYKLAPSQGQITPTTAGVVDYIHDMLNNRSPELSKYVIKTRDLPDTAAPIYLMPAGNLPSKNYWRQLSQLNWHQLIFEDTAQGVPLFLELKEQIRATYAPDYLLIDARTGITEVGGIATTILADQIVCLLANNQENLEGARAVLRSIKRAPRIAGASPIGIVPVLARIPEERTGDLEEKLALGVRDFLNAPAERLEDTLNIEKVFVFHSEPELQISEALRIGQKTPQESPLLRDYLLLFADLIPISEIEPQIETLINIALKRALDEPDSAQKDIEALVALRPHPESYKALLKFYRLRREDENKILSVAFDLWRLTRDSTDRILWDIIHSHPQSFHSHKEVKWTPEFIEDVWMSAGGTDKSVGQKLAQFYIAVNRPASAINIFRRLSSLGDIDTKSITDYAYLLASAGRLQEAQSLIREHKSKHKSSAEFQTMWAKTIINSGQKEEVYNLITDPDFELNFFLKHDINLWVQVLLATDNEHLVRNTLGPSMLPHIFRTATKETSENIGKFYYTHGMWGEFLTVARDTMPESFLFHIERLARTELQTRPPMSNPKPLTRPQE